jgi:hypothetical protein
MTQVVISKVTVGESTKGYTVRDGYVYGSCTWPLNIHDALVVKKLGISHTIYNYFREQSSHSFDEHIKLINDVKIEKAIIFSDEIGFINRCPELKHVRIIPAESSGNGFDYSPLYSLKNLLSVSCTTEYGRNLELKTKVDYSKFQSKLQKISVDGNGHINFNHLPELRSLSVGLYNGVSLDEYFHSSCLDTLNLTSCKIKNLDGIGKSQRMQCLYLAYDRTLSDISALRDVKDTLKLLRIENCAKIKDFSVLAELHNLELLQLSGSNELENLAFLKSLPNLRFFACDMNILDGDLTPCLDIPYIGMSRKRKHYNLDPNQFSRKVTQRGNEDIELWRRMEDRKSVV